MSMKSLDLTGIKSYEQAVEEARRVTDLPPWVHTGILAEYVRDVFLTKLTRRQALEKFCEDIGGTYSSATVAKWITDIPIWKKTSAPVRNKIRQHVYYHEAARSAKYQKGKSSATVAVLYQKRRRAERTFISTMSQIVTSYNMVERGEAQSAWITPERAREVLAMIPRIVAFLNAVVDKKRSGRARAA